MDGEMVTELTRTRVQSTANTSGPQTSKRTLSRGFAAQQSAVGSPSLFRGLVSTLIRNEQLAHQVLGQVAGGVSRHEYGWLFIDSDNMAWTTDASMSSFTSVGVKFPTTLVSYGSSGTLECVWTGTQWIFFDNTTGGGGFWRSETLNAWTQLSVPAIAVTPAIVLTDSPSVFYISGRNIGLWKTTDGGVTFAQKTLANVVVSGREVFEFFTDTLYSEGRLIHTGPRSPLGASTFTSDDDGATWTLRDAFVGVGNFELVKIGTTIYSGGRGTIRQSTDNGTTWTATTSTASTYNQGLRYTGSIWVTVGVAGGIRGPMWTSSLTGTPFVAGTTTSGTMYGFDSFKRQIHYNGTAFVYWDRNNSTCFRSTDGKVWSPLLHPNAAAGKKFFVGFPKIADPNKNLF